MVTEKLECSLAVSISTTASRTTATARVSLLETTGSLIRCDTITITTSDSLLWQLQPDEVDFWWSVGIGNQQLYDVKVELLDIVSSPRFA